MAGGWLHRGSIVCPSCNEICGDYFEQQGLECRIREEAPPSNKYPRDELHCNARNLNISSVLLLACLCLSFIK